MLFYEFNKQLDEGFLDQELSLAEETRHNKNADFQEFIRTIESKSFESNRIFVPLKFSENSEKQIFQIVFPRIAVALKNEKNINMQKYIIRTYKNLMIYEIKNEQNDIEKIKFLLSLLLNSSRSLLDNKKAIENSFNKLYGWKNFAKLNNAEEELVKKAKELF